MGGLLDITNQERAEAKKKALDALGRYKFLMFGYWAGVWVHLNRIMEKIGKGEPSPFTAAVKAVRQNPMAVKAINDGTKLAWRNPRLRIFGYDIGAKGRIDAQELLLTPAGLKDLSVVSHELGHMRMGHHRSTRPMAGIQKLLYLDFDAAYQLRQFYIEMEAWEAALSKLPDHSIYQRDVFMRLSTYVPDEKLIGYENRHRLFLLIDTFINNHKNKFIEPARNPGQGEGPIPKAFIDAFKTAAGVQRFAFIAVETQRDVSGQYRLCIVVENKSGYHITDFLYPTTDFKEADKMAQDLNWSALKLSPSQVSTIVISTMKKKKRNPTENIIELQARVNALIDQRRRYGLRKEITTDDGYDLSWSNEGYWYVDRTGKYFRPKGVELTLDANEVFVPNTYHTDMKQFHQYLLTLTGQEIEDDKKRHRYLSPLPLWGGSLERKIAGTPDFTGVEIPPMLKYIRDRDLPMDPATKEALERKAKESNPKKAWEAGWHYFVTAPKEERICNACNQLIQPGERHIAQWWLNQIKYGSNELAHYHSACWLTKVYHHITKKVKESNPKLFDGYLQPRDEEISCKRCGRTTDEANIYVLANITPTEYGTYCQECRDELRKELRRKK